VPTRNDESKPGALDALHVENRVFRPDPQTVIEANVTPADLESALALAAADPLAYWERAAEELEWHRRWERVLDDADPPRFRWFPGGRVNIAHNALDRHARSGNKNRLALIWEGEAGDCRKFTYYELSREVNRLANAFRSLGLVRGDRVTLYMPPLPETLIAMLAAAKVGASHSLVFAGFSARFLRQRINEARSKILVTADGFYRGGRVIALKPVVDDALHGVSPGCAETVVVVPRVGIDVEMTAPRDLYYHDVVRRESAEAACAAMESDDELFVLFTSGTTGRPKAVAHAHGGFMVGVHHTFREVFDVKPTDIYFCTADPGWITGHAYGVYGPLLAGATSIMYEGHPLYPQADRLWSMVARHGVTSLYTTPTLLRLLMRYGPQYPKKHDLSTLRLLGSVGEPIGAETWLWLHKHIGRSRCPVLDTWWQTETGMMMISPLPISPLKPGSVGKPLPGVAADVVDAAGNSLPPGQGGFLVIRKPWPGMFKEPAEDMGEARACLADYWNRIPGMYFAGDMARRDEDGYFFIQGRADDVLNIAGRRMGTAELEAALLSHRAVAEAAVIGLPDRIKGQVAKAFVVPSPGFEDQFDGEDGLRADIARHVRRELGPIVAFKAIEIREALPHTRSGKILRRALRDGELGVETEVGEAQEDE